MSCPASLVINTAGRETLAAIRAAGISELGTAGELLEAASERLGAAIVPPVDFLAESACLSGDVALLRCLRLRWGWTPTRGNAQIAAWSGHISVLDYMVGECGLASEELRAGRVVCAAASKGHVDVLAWLLAHGVTAADARDDQNKALRIAASRQHIAVVRHLFDEWGFGPDDAAQIPSVADGSDAQNYSPEIKEYFANRFALILDKMPVIYFE